MASESATQATPSTGGCPVHRINEMSELVQTVRSKSVLNSSRYFAAAHKDPAGQLTVDNFVNGMMTFTDGDEHRRRRKLLNQLVRPESLNNFRENYVVPAMHRLMTQKLVEPGADGYYRCDLVELADLLFLNFGANLIGFQNMDDDDRMERLREIVPAIFGGILAQFFDDKETINRVALDAKKRFVDEFYTPARDAYLEMYRKVEAGEMDEADVPRTLMRLLVTQADPVYADEEIAIREALLIFNTAVGTSTQAVVNMVDDVTKWFASHPEDSALSTDMDFLTRALQETVRLKAPFISFLVREAGDDVVINDKHIHKGDEIHIEIAQSNRDTAVFGPDAGEFNPWRKSPDKVPRYGIGFGSGPHACLGLRVVLGNDGHDGSHVRFMQALFRYGVQPDPDGEPQVVAMSADESSMDSIPTFATYPVVFTDWTAAAATELEG